MNNFHEIYDINKETIAICYLVHNKKRDELCLKESSDLLKIQKEIQDNCYFFLGSSKIEKAMETAILIQTDRLKNGGDIEEIRIWENELKFLSPHLTDRELLIFWMTRLT